MGLREFMAWQRLAFVRRVNRQNNPDPMADLKREFD